MRSAAGSLGRPLARRPTRRTDRLIAGRPPGPVRFHGATSRDNGRREVQALPARLVRGGRSAFSRDGPVRSIATPPDPACARKGLPSANKSILLKKRALILQG